MKLKVVHIITELTLGGAQINTVLHFCHHNPDLFETYLIYGQKEHLNVECFPERQFRIKALKRNILPWWDLLALLQLFLLLKRIAPDIVHTHSFKAGVLGRIAARLAGVRKIVHTYHGFSFSPVCSKLRKKVFILLERILNTFTTRLILVSREDLENGIKEKLFRQDRASLIYSGFDFQPFKKSYNKEEERERFGIPKQSFVCGVIAPFKPQKNLLFLVDVAAIVVQRFPDVLFFIAGDGGLRQKLEKKVNELKLAANFLLPGFIREIAAAIATFDIGISVSLWEGLPQSLVQMRLMKKAIVSSDISGNREIVQHGKNGFLCSSFDRLQFAQRIIQLIEDKKLREILENYQEDLSYWNYQKMVATTDNLYLKMMNIF